MNKRDDDDDDDGYDGTKAGLLDDLVLWVVVLQVLVLVLPLLSPVLCRRAMHLDTAGVTDDVTVHAVIVVVVVERIQTTSSCSTLDIDAADDETTGILDLLLRELPVVEFIIIIERDWTDSLCVYCYYYYDYYYCRIHTS